jgi:adenylylsulfate kinase
MIILIAGLPGSGKTTLAKAVSARCGGTVLNKDDIRAALFPPEQIEYSTEQDDFCLKVMLDVARYLFRKNSSALVFIDGRPFSREYQISQVLQAAEELEQPWLILHCVCSEVTARKRLQQAGHVAGNRDFELYERVRDLFEKIQRSHLVVDTDQPLDDCVEQVLSALQ